MGRGKIPQLVLKQLGRRLAGKPLRDANRLLARHLTADSRIWRQVSEHIARHYSDDAGPDAGALTRDVSLQADQIFRSLERSRAANRGRPGFHISVLTTFAVSPYFI